MKVKDVPKTKLVDFHKISKMIQMNIRLYEPVEKEKEKDFIWSLVHSGKRFKNIKKEGLPCIDIGLYKGHCFYIKDIQQLINIWEWVGCEQRFNRKDNYKRHVSSGVCSAGKTKVDCYGKKIPIQNSSEKVFYAGNTQFSYAGCQWIESQSLLIGKHIHHALCGHGDERVIRTEKKNT